MGLYCEKYHDPIDLRNERWIGRSMAGTFQGVKEAIGTTGSEDRVPMQCFEKRVNNPLDQPARTCTNCQHVGNR